MKSAELFPMVHFPSFLRIHSANVTSKRANCWTCCQQLLNGSDNKPHATLVHSYTFYSNGISS